MGQNRKRGEVVKEKIAKTDKNRGQHLIPTIKSLEGEKRERISPHSILKSQRSRSLGKTFEESRKGGRPGGRKERRRGGLA